MKRKILAFIAALAVFASVLGMAASLGGVSSASLGADSTVVASCDSDGVSTSYTTSYDGTAGEYVVTAVTVAGISNTCDGSSIGVTLTNGSGTSLGAGSTTIPTNAGSTSVTVTLSTAGSAENAANVHVVIA